MVDIIDADIPLLFSKSSLAKAKAVINFDNNEIDILGQRIQLKETSSGHFLLPLNRPMDPSEVSVKRILLANKFDDTNIIENKRKVLKLHKQFCHPPIRRMKKFLSDAGIEDKHITDLV